MDALVRGHAMGSISMTCYGLGTEVDCKDALGAAVLPADVPPDQTNM